MRRNCIHWFKAKAYGHRPDALSKLHLATRVNGRRFQRAVRVERGDASEVHRMNRGT
jgi:hypothetical protein